MALGILEIRRIQKEIEERYAKLEEQGLGIRVMRALQGEIEERYALLEGGEAPAPERSLLERLEAGEFDAQACDGYIKMLRSVVDEQGGDFECIKKSVVRYIDKHKDEIFTVGGDA